MKDHELEVQGVGNWKESLFFVDTFLFAFLFAGLVDTLKSSSPLDPPILTEALAPPPKEDVSTCNVEKSSHKLSHLSPTHTHSTS